MMRILRKGIEKKTDISIMPLYRSMLWHHVKYCVQFWLLYLQKDIAELENLQMRATKLIKTEEFETFDYR